MTPDVNVLVAASRLDHPHHDVASNWLHKALADRTLALLPMVVASFVRILTNPRVFNVPTPPKTAVLFIDTLIDDGEVLLLTVADEWGEFRDLVNNQTERSLKANTIPDAWIAAAVLHHSEHLVTYDRDFRKLLPRTRVTVLAT